MSWAWKKLYNLETWPTIVQLKRNHSCKPWLGLQPAMQTIAWYPCYIPPFYNAWCSFLRTYATKYFPHWNLFNTLHTVCYMHRLSIYKIKRICHRAHFFINSYRRFQHLVKFLDITQVFKVNFNYCFWPQAFFRKRIFFLFSQVITRYCMIYFLVIPQK